MNNLPQNLIPLIEKVNIIDSALKQLTERTPHAMDNFQHGQNETLYSQWQLGFYSLPNQPVQQ